MADKLLTDLDPELQRLCEQVIAAYTALGRKIVVTETWRDPVREDMLHAQGITMATGRTCKHCVMAAGKPASRAFDFALYTDGGDYIADGTHPYYADAGKIGIDLGLIWGGHFSHPDWDHLELPDDETVTP